MTLPSGRLRLLLVFSRFMSLAEWDRLGMFEREVAIYRRLVNLGVDVGFMTYGGREELDFASRLPGISIHPNRWNLKPRHYERLAPLLHAPKLARVDVVKTNQVSSVYAAAPASQLWRKRLLGRMGFLPSDFAARGQGENSQEYENADALESRLFAAADSIVVTTREMAASIKRRYPAQSGKIAVIPNYVDTDLFAPSRDRDKRYDLLFVGRLAPQKNLPALLHAIDGLNMRAHIVGNGEMSHLVEERVSASQGRITWQKHVPNRQLPELMALSRLFVLPSLWEGHPKTLLEAMSAGMPVLGTRVVGIQGQIEHGRTGWLCETDANSLADAIRLLLAQEGLMRELGEAARSEIEGGCALDKVAAAEHQLLTALANGTLR